MTADVSALLDLIARQVDLCDRLLKLAQQQRQCVQRDEPDALMHVLAQRNEVLELIMQIETRLKPLKQNWPAVRQRLATADREAAEDGFARTREAIAAVTAADADDVLLLQQRKLNVGRELAAARSGAGANRHYAATAYAATHPSVDIAQ